LGIDSVNYTHICGSEATFAWLDSVLSPSKTPSTGQQVATITSTTNISGDAKVSSSSSFAAGGLFGGGLRLVGEKGPELEVTGPSRIYTANQTRSMLMEMMGGMQESYDERMSVIMEDLNTLAENQVQAGQYYMMIAQQAMNDRSEVFDHYIGFLQNYMAEREDSVNQYLSMVNERISDRTNFDVSSMSIPQSMASQEPSIATAIADKIKETLTERTTAVSDQPIVVNVKVGDRELKDIVVETMPRAIKTDPNIQHEMRRVMK